MLIQLCPLISSSRAVLPRSSLLLRRPVRGCTDYITQHFQLHAGLARGKLPWFTTASPRAHISSSGSKREEEIRFDSPAVLYYVCQLVLHTTLWLSTNLALNFVP